MKKQTEFDEKQQLERGKAYRNGYFTLLALLLIDFFIKDALEITWLTNYSSFIIMFWISISVCEITMIVKDAYDGISNNYGRTILSLQGFLGLAILFMDIMYILSGKEVISSMLSSLLMGVCCVIICSVYWIKVIRDKNFIEV